MFSKISEPETKSELAELPASSTPLSSNHSNPNYAVVQPSCFFPSHPIAIHSVTSISIRRFAWPIVRPQHRWFFYQPTRDLSATINTTRAGFDTEINPSPTPTIEPSRYPLPHIQYLVLWSLPLLARGSVRSVLNSTSHSEAEQSPTFWLTTTIIMVSRDSAL